MQGQPRMRRNEDYYHILTTFASPSKPGGQFPRLLWTRSVVGLIKVFVHQRSQAPSNLLIAHQGLEHRSTQFERQLSCQMGIANEENSRSRQYRVCVDEPSKRNTWRVDSPGG